MGDLIIEDNVNPPDTVIIVNPDPCDPDTIYFINDILPLLNMSCAQVDCHDAITHEEGVEMYDYAHIKEEVTPGNLDDSDLWGVINETGDDAMPPDGPLSSEQMLAIQTWILQGAKNNGCQEDCDPTQFSFTTNIAPIVALTCAGCHSGGSPSGNLSLETFDQIRASTLDGSLMNSLLATNGATLMPNNSTGLPECYISQFQLWVDAGAPNN